MSTPETTIPDGGPAFPAGPFGDTMHGEDGRTWHQFPATSGMTLRDWFAGMALQGLMSQEDERTCPQHRINDVAGWRKELHLEDARDCYAMADAMLERRLK